MKTIFVTRVGMIIAFSFAFAAYGVSPTVTTKAASSIDSFSATLNGTVNPNGSNVVAYFSWGTTPSYSGNYVPSPPWTESGNSTITLSYTMTNLSANTKYYYQTVSYVFGNSGNISYGGSSNFTTLYPPILNVSPSSGLTSTGYLGGPFIPPNEPYSVANINIGSGTLKWTASADQNWVTVSPTNGQTTVGNPATVTVSFNGNANSLAIGSHSSTVTFGGNGGSTTRQVQLTVSSPPPALSVSPLTGLTSSGHQGGSFSPASKQYTISNTGGGTLYWSASADQNWVTISPTSGQNSGTVTVTINNNANSLSAQGFSWTYTSYVTFSANVGNVVTNIILAVNLTVTTAPQLSVSPSSNLTSSGDHGGPFSPASQQYSLSNVGTGTLNWTAGADANWVTVSSSSGQNSGNVTVSINANANSLSAGTYSSTVTFSGNGGSITRQVQLTVTNAPVSSSLSALAAAPSSTPADGSSQIAATATLRDVYGNPVAGRTVQFYAIGSVSINQPVNPTDANGQATATITANTPGTVTITVKDTTDNVAVQQPATVTFTQQTLVAPNANLGNAIMTLYQSSASALNGGVLSFSATATNAGALGNAFRNGMTADEASTILDAAFGVAGAIATIPDTEEYASLLAQPGSKALATIGQTPSITDSQISYLIDKGLTGAVGANRILQSAFVGICQEYGQEELEDKTTDFYISSLNNIAADPNSPRSLGNDAVASCNTSQQTLLQQEQNLLNNGVPPALNQASWTTDLQSRSRVGPTFQAVLIQQDQFLQQAAAAKSQSTQQWNSWFAVRFGLTVAAGLMGDGPGSLLVGGIFTIASEYNDGRNLSSDQISYFSAISLLSGCFQYAGQTYLNTANAYGEISGNLASDPVTAQIGPMSDVENGYTAVGLFGLQSVFSATNASSSIIITNTSSESATFEVFVLSSYSGSAYGVQIANFSQVSFIAATISAGANMAIPILYYDGAHGGIPDSGPAFPMVVYVLGNNQSGTFYIGSFSHNWNPTFMTSGSVWQPLAIRNTQNSPVKPLDDGGSSSNGVAEIENPVSTYVVQNPSNQTYQAEIFVVNPFGQSCTAIVTQALPSGINVLTTDGASGASGIVWTNNISTNVAEDTFTFTISVAPGAQTNLPPPTVTFIDQTNNQSSPFNSTVPGFNGLFPVQVSGSIPFAVWGIDSPMFVAVTNLTGTSQTGSLTVTLTNSSGNMVTNVSQSFSLNGLGGTNLNFILPGSLPSGSYTLTGSLTINGGTGQILAGNYVVPAQPVTLGVDSPAIDANGVHIVLNGPPGSNYVITATSNLADPTTQQAILFLSPTNTPISITVPMATNASQQFFRAMKL